MLYSMGRYDEFPGDPDVDAGSSLRGAMKGWYKHGACSDRLWTSEKMPTDHVAKCTDDWWLDAVRRPLGAYYRIDTRSITDMHVALNESGILYASAVCHSGWDDGFSKKSLPKDELWVIPHRKASLSDGGHAFAVVGYNQVGFIVHNSWGTRWGTKGRAVLPYEDWLDNAMDCWVAQLGVVTEQHLKIAQSPTLRLESGKVQLAGESSLRRREISPFIIDMENNGSSATPAISARKTQKSRRWLHTTSAWLGPLGDWARTILWILPSMRMAVLRPRTMREKRQQHGYQRCTNRRFSLSSSCGKQTSGPR
jgi:hypothetical protein